MKKLLAVLTVLALALAIPALATSAATVPERPPFIAAYEGNGVVEIDFPADVRWRDLSVTAADMFGDAQTVTVLERDDDELTFRIENAKDEMIYTFTVTGVEGQDALTGEIVTPAAGHTLIQKVELDDGGREIELMGPGEYDNPAVTLTAADGTAIEAEIVERDDDSIEVRAKGVVRGGEYTVTVSGVGLRGSGVSGTVTRAFIARGD